MSDTTFQAWMPLHRSRAGNAPRRVGVQLQVPSRYSAIGKWEPERLRTQSGTIARPPSALSLPAGLLPPWRVLRRLWPKSRKNAPECSGRG